MEKMFRRSVCNSSLSLMELNNHNYHHGNQLQLYGTCFSRNRQPHWSGFPETFYKGSDICLSGPNYNPPFTPSSLSASTSVDSLNSASQIYLTPDLSSCRQCSLSLSSESGFSSNGSGSGTNTNPKSKLDKKVYTQPPFHQNLGLDLWKDNPDHDKYNTFSVSETEVTQVIEYLENRLSIQGEGTPSSPEITDNVRNSEQELGPVSPKVTFVLDTYCNIYMFGKQDLRELKMLQKQENKQYQDLLYKAQCAREGQERRFDIDMQKLVQNYDQDMETLTKQQKQQVERAESTQQLDMKSAGKRIKIEQEKEYKTFKEQQRQEMKLLKQELDLMPKDNKKESARKKKDQKEIELAEKERQFFENQQERMEKHMKQLSDTHRQKVALLESQFLQQKQQLLRSRESVIWETEKQQLHEKHQLAKSQLKDMFFLKRHQMLTRHQKEVEQMKRSNTTKEEEMQSRHTLEKKRLPKILKSEAKTRANMFKQSLRLSTIGSPEDDRAKMKQFEENEKKRMKAEQQRQEQKHKRQWEELVFRNDTSLRELEALQAEKRKMLMEHETQKIKELDEQYANELREWKNQLTPRKQRLEEEFQRQREEQEKFYGTVLLTGNDGAAQSPPRSQPNSLRGNREDGTKSSRHSTVI